jgi:hypothetical protein
MTNGEREKLREEFDLFYEWLHKDSLNPFYWWPFATIERVANFWNEQLPGHPVEFTVLRFNHSDSPTSSLTVDASNINSCLYTSLAMLKDGIENGGSMVFEMTPKGMAEFGITVGDSGGWYETSPHYTKEEQLDILKSELQYLAKAS